MIDRCKLFLDAVDGAMDPAIYARFSSVTAVTDAGRSRFWEELPQMSVAFRKMANVLEEEELESPRRIAFLRDQVQALEVAEARFARWPTFRRIMRAALSPFS